jgi:hypothetical protein
MRGTSSFLAGALALAAIASARAEPSFDPATTFSKLLANVRPIAYRIDLFPNVAKLATAGAKEDIEFRGEEEIDLQVLRATSTLTLNAVTSLSAEPQSTPPRRRLPSTKKPARRHFVSRALWRLERTR